MNIYNNYDMRSTVLDACVLFSEDILNVQMKIKTIKQRVNEEKNFVNV